MATFRRIVKFMPLVLMGVLLLLWALSLRVFVNQPLHWDRYAGVISVYNGNACYSLISGEYLAESWTIENGVEGDLVPRPEIGAVSFFGHFEVINADMGWVRGWSGQMPMLVIVTLLLPIVTGSLTAFRFRLWHYLAYTALVALQLAYHLRWQET